MSVSHQLADNHNPELERIRKAFIKIYRDRVAFFYLIVLVFLYLSVAFADLLAPYSEQWFDRALAKSPPTPVYMVDENGSLSWPYVFRYERRYDPNTFTQQYFPN